MVHDLNSNLNQYTHTNVINDGTNCTENKYWWVERIGKQINMFGRIYLQTLEPSVWYTIGQIPEGYKPNVTHSNCLLIACNTVQIECNVASSGSVAIRANTKVTPSYYPMSSISWITNDQLL